ncbi:hypothetical protein [Desertimonas flava]|uniref:hypothetical protein n=1 Tax=Desertimonas flava TaxID=2064846 RepID=UPI0017810F58|nr:hypothetical protein [Desertimonas flava]
MSDELEAALVLARSRDCRDRWAAAYALAWRAGDERAEGALLALLNDADDSSVTCAAAASLLEARTDAALRLFAIGWHRADDSSGDWQADALFEATHQRQLRIERWVPLAHSDEEEVRSGAKSILVWLGADRK